MKKSTKTSPSVTETTTVLEQPQLIRAALNLPANEFVLGDRTFQIVDLPYDSYIEFVSYLTPLIDAAIQKLSGSGMYVPGLTLNASLFSSQSILSALGKELPEMVHIICRQSDPEITIEEIKKLAGKPMPLVAAVLKQIQHNDIIKDFTDFFAQILSVVKTLTPTAGQSI